jgi:hypothetical protein
LVESAISLQLALKDSLKTSRRTNDLEDEARAKILDVLAASPQPLIQALEARFKRHFYIDDASMTAAYTAAVASVSEGAPSPDTSNAIHFVGAAVVFGVVDDRELEVEIADILGVSYKSGGFPGPRLAPAWAGPR